MRCPHCGKNNYGDVTKCFSCGQDMKTATGRAVVAKPMAPKSKTMKRIRMPIFMIIGIAVAFLGLISTFLPYFVLTASPTDFERDQNGYFIDGAIFNYQPGDTREVRGEITFKLKCNNGYIYELKGSGSFKSETGADLVGDKSYTSYTENAREDNDMTFWSEDGGLGNVGDTAYLEVKVMTDSSEAYVWLEDTESHPLMIKYFLIGPIFIIIGGLIFLLGFIGKKDKSMEAYLESHPELKKGDIALSEYQKQQAELQKQEVMQSRQVNYSQPASPMAGGSPPPTGQPMAGPPAGQMPQSPPQKPTSGICRDCNQPALSFKDDGTGQCMNCHRAFVWDPSRAPAQAPPQAAPGQPISFEGPK